VPLERRADGRWLGTVRTPDKTNEIRAARTLLERIDQRHDLTGKVVVLDSLHTNQETARLIVQELGADYLFTIKTNQETLHKTVHGLLRARAFSPSGSHAQRPDTRNQSGAQRTTPIATAGHDARAGMLCGGQPDRGTQELHPTQEGGNDGQDLADNHQR